MRRKPKESFLGDKATEEWLHSLSKRSSRASYSTLWGYFLEFTGLTGDQILESRKKDENYLWEKKTIEFKQWMIEKKGQSPNSAATATGAVRGFFAYYRQPLKFRRIESAQLKEAEPKYEDYRFSREDLKRICDFADLEEKYVITAGKSFGLRPGDFLRLTRGHLEPYLERPVPIFIGEITTQKEKVKAYPFIDSDALPVIKLMIESMDREGRKDPNDRILTYSHEIQLSRTLKRVADKAGIKHGSKRIRFHNLRKYLIDRLSSHMSESKWKQIVGKKISEGAYVSPDSLREDYARAMADTCFTLTPEGDIATVAKVEALKAIAKTMGITDNELSTIFAKRKTLKRTSDDVLRDLEEVIKQRQRTQTNGGSENCPNGIHCEKFEQITEGNLLQYLKDGWQIVHKLATGEVIVKR